MPIEAIANNFSLRLFPTMVFFRGLVAVHTILSKWLYWRSRISLLKFYTIFLCFHDFHLENVDHGMEWKGEVAEDYVYIIFCTNEYHED